MGSLMSGKPFLVLFLQGPPELSAYTIKGSCSSSKVIKWNSFLSLNAQQSFILILDFSYWGFFYSFFFVWLHWVFIAHGLSLVAAGSTLRCGAWASHCSGFSLLRSTGSRRTRFGSCGTRAQ